MTTTSKEIIKTIQPALTHTHTNAHTQKVYEQEYANMHMHIVVQTHTFITDYDNCLQQLQLRGRAAFVSKCQGFYCKAVTIRPALSPKDPHNISLD